jgi:hypothetical protein
VGISPVRPEEQNSVELWLNVGHLITPLWKDPQQTSVLLKFNQGQFINYKIDFETPTSMHIIMSKSTRENIFYLDVPLFVEVVDGCNAAAVSVWIVYVLHVLGAFARVAGNHRLLTQIRAC